MKMGEGWGQGWGKQSPRRACLRHSVVGKLNVGMRRFCSVGKILLVSLGGKKRKRDEKQKALLSPEKCSVMPVSPGPSEDNSYLGRAVPHLKSLHASNSFVQVIVYLAVFCGQLI